MMRKYLLPVVAIVLGVALTGGSASARMLEPGRQTAAHNESAGVDCASSLHGCRPARTSLLARPFDLAMIDSSFTIAFTGDLILHAPVVKAAAEYGRSTDTRFDFLPMFTEVAGILTAADLAICHLEVPLSPTSTGLSGYPTFLGPGELAAALVSAGYDGCSAASNHSYDRGAAGVVDTLEVMAAAGLGSAGTAGSAAESAITTYQVGGVRVAHLSYTYWLNGFTLPADQPWLVDLIDERAILAEAHAAKTKGADVVVVSLHWGAEYRTTPTASQTELGRRLIAVQAIDLIIGHHAHVVQPVEQVNGEYIVYGLGNFLSNQRGSAYTQDGVIVTVEFARDDGQWQASHIGFTPTWVEPSTYRILPAVGESSTLAASWARTSATMTSLSPDPEATVNR